MKANLSLSAGRRIEGEVEGQTIPWRVVPAVYYNSDSMQFECSVHDEGTSESNRTRGLTGHGDFFVRPRLFTGSPDSARLFSWPDGGSAEQPSRFICRHEGCSRREAESASVEDFPEEAAFIRIVLDELYIGETTAGNER